MEVSIFTRPEVARELARYVEIRLHTDKSGSEEAEQRSRRFQDYKLRLTRSASNPIYVVIDPDDPDTPLAKFAGADLTGQRFRRFLEVNAG